MGEWKQKITEYYIITTERLKKKPVRNFLIIVCLLFSLFTALKINGSSINSWNSVEGIDFEETTLIGKPKGVRSDEWFVRTPLLYSQYLKGFPINNENIGEGNTPLLMNLPVKDILMIVRPQFWGYFLFDFSTGFAWEWNFKVFCLVFSSFWLIYTLTKGNWKLSLLGMIWIYLSSFTQWWFSTSLPEIMFSVFFLIVFFYKLLLEKSYWKCLLWGGLITMFLLNLFLTFYPPFIISMCYMAAPIVIAFIISAWRNLFKEKKLLVVKLLVLAMVFLISGLGVYHFYMLEKDTMNIVMNTVYPGKRVSVGGYPVGDLLFGLIALSMPEKMTPSYWGNICEASSFFMIWPITVIIIVYYRFVKNVKISAMQLALIIYLVAMSILVLVPLPEFFYKITLLSYVPSHRNILGIGVGGILLTVLYLNDMSIAVDIKKSIKQLPTYIMIMLITIVLVLATYKVELHYLSNNLILKSLITLGSAGICFIASIILFIRKKYFYIIILAVSLPNILVNPVNIDLPKINEQPIVKQVDNTGGDWIIYGNVRYANLMYFSRAHVLNGTKYTPPLDWLDSIDPEKKYENVYNRFAHISVRCVAESSDSFVLDYPDSYTIYNDTWPKDVHILNLYYTCPK